VKIKTTLKMIGVLYSVGEVSSDAGLWAYHASFGKDHALSAMMLQHFNVEPSLFNAWHWKDAPGGHKYWENINNQIERKEKI